MTSTFQGMDHIGIAVTDLAVATATYRDVLGLTDHGEETLPDRGITVRFLSMGGADNTRIELLASNHPHSELAAFLQKRGEGIHHICMRVSNIDAAVQHLTASGARIVGGNDPHHSGVQQGAHNTRVAFVHPKSTHGVLIELVEVQSSAAASTSGP